MSSYNNKRSRFDNEHVPSKVSRFSNGGPEPSSSQSQALVNTNESHQPWRRSQQDRNPWERRNGHHNHHHRGHGSGGGGAASHLASIYGSEQDKVNCSFYLKIGACRHGDKCSRKHNKPQYSTSIVIPHLYQNPNHNRGHNTNDSVRLNETELKEYFDKFYEDIFVELSSYGNLEELHVCDNIGDHLVGNVYARFKWEEQAEKAVTSLNERWFAGRPVFAELSPVTDFREARCRQNEVNECNRGGLCNFMHLRYPSSELLYDLKYAQRLEREMHPDPEDMKHESELAELRNPNKHTSVPVPDVDDSESASQDSRKNRVEGGYDAFRAYHLVK